MAKCKTKKSEDLIFIVEELTFDLCLLKLPKHIIMFEGVNKLRLDKFLSSPRGDKAKTVLKDDLCRVIKKYIRESKL